LDIGPIGPLVYFFHGNGTVTQTEYESNEWLLSIMLFWAESIDNKLPTPFGDHYCCLYLNKEKIVSNKGKKERT